jgi:tRNA-dihydrouridine synthase A
MGRVDRRHALGHGCDHDAAIGLVQQARLGVPWAAVARHMLGLFHAMPGGRIWRRILTVEGNKPGAGLEVVDAALAAVREAFERRRDAA